MIKRESISLNLYVKSIMSLCKEHHERSEMLKTTELATQTGSKAQSYTEIKNPLWELCLQIYEIISTVANIF